MAPKQKKARPAGYLGVFAVSRIAVNAIGRIMWARIDDKDKASLLFSLAVGRRTCRVCCCDPKWVEHVVEVTADSLYEALAQCLQAFRENDWVDDLGGGLTTITVVVS
jgi:hypothetical protein